MLAAATWMAPGRATAAPLPCPQPLRDRYEAGETVRIVGYTSVCLSSETESAAREGPDLWGWLHADPCVEPTDSRGMLCPGFPAGNPATGRPLGRFVLEQTAHEGRGLRMSLTFTLPDDLRAGVYLLDVCRYPCSTPLAYTWPSRLYVGADPPDDWRPIRHWPLDDPAIDELAADALLLGRAGRVVTAAEARTAAPADQRHRPTDGDDGSDRNGRSDRIETAASASDTRPDGRGGADGGDLPTSFWLVAGGLALLAAWAASGRGPTRKRVRPRR